MKSQDKRSLIVSQLAELEKQENITILYACESGSRAWGFASRDSDWDVRFIYVRPHEWYLSIDLERKRDVIELEIVNDLDINGWDIRKALNLFQKTNPPLIEWLHSPIVYVDRTGFKEKLYNLLPKYYSHRSCFYHYLHMAKRNYREYLKGKTVRIKRYLYVLRPLLALRWLEVKKSIVPVPFAVLLDEISSGEKMVYEAVCSLLERKKRGDELDVEPKLPVLNDFIERELSRLAETASGLEKISASVEPLNEFFRKVVGEVVTN